MTSRAIQSNPSFDSSLVPSLGSFMPQYRTSYHTENCLPSEKCDLPDLTFNKLPLGRFNQIHIFTIHWYLLKKVHLNVKVSCIMTSRSSSWRQEVRHDVKKFVMTSTIHHDVKKFTKTYKICQKCVHDTKNTSWRQNVRHDMQNK